MRLHGTSPWYLRRVTGWLGPGSFVSFNQPATLAQGFRELVLFAAIELLGFGLAFERKWAALYFSVPLCLYGLRITFVSNNDGVFPFNLLVMLPLFVTIRYWRQLTWGERFF